MLNALKKMDKKFLIIAVVIVGLPIFIIIFLAIFQSCSNSKMSYEEYELKMKQVAEEYFSESQLKKMSEGEVITVSLSKIVKKNKIKAPEEALDDTSCDGNISVRKNGSTLKDNDGGLFNYIVNLKCDNYKTKTLINALTSNVVDSEDGLYKTDNGYIFKGEKVDNYINFFGREYRIISVDNDGLLKLIKVEKESLDKYWDIKYNTETQSSTGKNIYKDSYIRSELIELYFDGKKISSSARKHIVAKDLCVDPRSKNDLSLTSKNECNNILEDQMISLIDVVDFANASLDVECVNLKSRSCINYNYMRLLRLDTWTYRTVSENSYEVYSLSSGIVSAESADKYLSFNYVIYIDGNEIYESGDGSESSPFIIK